MLVFFNNCASFPKPPRTSVSLVVTVKLAVFLPRSGFTKLRTIRNLSISCVKFRENCGQRLKLARLQLWPTILFSGGMENRLTRDEFVDGRRRDCT